MIYTHNIDAYQVIKAGRNPILRPVKVIGEVGAKYVALTYKLKFVHFHKWKALGKENYDRERNQEAK